MQAVDREVAGEEAPVDAERARWRLEPRARTRRRSSTRAAWPGPDSLQMHVRRRAPASASMPACHSARSSSAVRPGPAGVLDDDDEVVEAGQARGRGLRAGRGGPSARTRRPRSCSARSTSASGSGPVERAHRPDAPEAGWPPSAGRAAPTASATESVGGRPPTMASGWPSASARAVELERLVDRVAAGGGGHVHQLLDVPPGRLGPVGRHVEAAGHARDVAHVRAPCRPTGTGTSRCGPGSHRCTWASTMRAGRVVIGPPRRADARAARRRTSPGSPVRRR